MSFGTIVLLKIIDKQNTQTGKAGVDLLPLFFQAIWREEQSIGVKEVRTTDLPEGDVLIRTAYSSLNYKDALACSGNRGVVKQLPIIPGIDLTGTVVRSANAAFREGDRVIVTGYELGTAHHGGFAEYASVPAAWVQPLPETLSLREAALLGTAGLTAALSLHRLQLLGLRPESGPVLVTGASGGVGSLAVALLARQGYAVTASTGKAETHAWLRALGAEAVVPREAIAPAERRPLERQQWAAVVDTVGGSTLAAVLAAVRYGGAVAASGLTGGTELPATVFPFILRGVSLLGIDSVYCPGPLRQEIWRHLSGAWKPTQLEEVITSELALGDVPDYAAAALQGTGKGRTLVRIGGGE